MFVNLSLWDSAVNGIMITLRKECGSNPSRSTRYFSLLRRVQTGDRIHPALL